MADPAHLEALQAGKAQEARQATHEQAVRRLLAVLDPQNSDARLDSRALIHRAQAVLTQELEQLGD